MRGTASLALVKSQRRAADLACQRNAAAWCKGSMPVPTQQILFACIVASEEPGILYITKAGSTHGWRSLAADHKSGFFQGESGAKTNSTTLASSPCFQTPLKMCP